MKKRFISILLCMAMAVGCIFVPTTASAADGEATTCSKGPVVKCGKYLYSIALDGLDNSDSSDIIRTTVTGGSPKVVVEDVTSISGYIFTYKTKFYYQDKNKIKCYNTKSSKVSTLKSFKYKGDIDDDFSVSGITAVIRGICPKGLIVEQDKKGIYLINFKGKSKKIAGAKENKIKSYNEYVTATDKYVFYHISEKKSKGIYTDRLYRYDLKKGSLKKMGTYKSDKIAEAPHISDSYIFKDKILFISMSFDKSYMTVGTVYSMDKNGNNIKKIKSGVDLTFKPGKGCVYVQQTDAKSGKYALYKISSKGKVTTAIKPTKLSVNKPILAATTTTGYSLNMKMSKDYMSYDIYRNGKPSLKKGNLVMTGKSQCDSDEQVAMPLPYGTYKDMVLLTYAVMDMEDEDDATYRTYLVNAKTGSYQLISK